MQTWSTEGHAALRPFGSWADDLAQAFVRLEPQKVVDEPFHGRIVKVDGGVMQISRVDASGHQVRRLQEHIVKERGDIAFVNLQVRGAGRTAQGGKEMRAGPGDIVVVDTTQPFVISHARDFTLFSLAVERHRLPERLRRGGAIRLTAGDSGRQISRLLLTYAALSQRPDADEADVAMYAGHILDLLRHASMRFDIDADDGCWEAPRLPIIMDFIRQNLGDGKLSVGTIAGTFGLSRRHVHKLFAAAGMTPSSFVNEQRLDYAAHLLQLPFARPRTITGIAMHAGYSLSYFNRRFKRRFGETPGDFRRRHLWRPIDESSSR